MSDLLRLLAVAGGLIGIVSFVGLVFVFLRGSADKGTMESQKRSIDALTTELGIERGKRIELEGRVKVCEARNSVLESTVQRLPELNHLQETCDRILELVEAT